MGDIPTMTRVLVMPRMTTKTYVLSDCRVHVEGWLHEDHERLADVSLTLRPTNTRSETDILRDERVQHFLTLVGKKLSVRLSRRIPVDINTFRPPSYTEFLTGHNGPATDNFGKLYAECRGLSASILWMLHKDFPRSFKND